MYLLAYSYLFLALFIALGLGAWALVNVWRDKEASVVWMERGQILLALLLSAAGGALLLALLTQDFSLSYVYQHTDVHLPWYYALSAFWAGQEGSFLFWAILVAIMGALWIASPGYRRMPLEIKNGFWLFFFLFLALFLLILTTTSNPFTKVTPIPSDGTGLNPLLQDPGMIFHPPIFFLGYAGFTIPACVAFAVGISGNNEYAWLRAIRNWALLAWVFLTAGIIIGAWWAYMELGWGTYWAWDPVENVSLLPWFTASAFLHTSLLGRRYKVLGKSNIALIGLTLAMCFLATFVTRSGVLDSLHAFGDREAGQLFLGLILFTLVLVTMVALGSQRRDRKSLADIFSRQGTILVLTWLLLALTAVIGGATLFPVVGQTFFQTSQALDAGFYNRVSLPLFVVIFLLLALCPGLKWLRPGLERMWAIFVPVVFVVSVVVLWVVKMQEIFPLVSTALILSACASVLMLMISQISSGKGERNLSVWALHLGLGIFALGVAVSGPYEHVEEAELSKGESVALQDYTLTFQQLDHRRMEQKHVTTAHLEVFRDEQKKGVVSPQFRNFAKFERNYVKASVLPGLGDEIYVTLLAIGQNDSIRIKARIMPMVNWLWIGGTLICLFGFLAIRRM